MPSLRILIVEDHACTNRVLTNQLTRRGHWVASAASVKDALNAAGTQCFDLAIIDITLSDGNGWDLFRQLRSLQPALQAIAMTGHGYEGDVLKSFDRGFAAHLVKPCTMEVLNAEIQRCAALANAVREDGGSARQPHG